jgi:hypothetical protein
MKALKNRERVILLLSRADNLVILIEIFGISEKLESNIFPPLESAPIWSVPEPDPTLTINPELKVANISFSTSFATVDGRSWGCDEPHRHIGITVRLFSISWLNISSQSMCLLIYFERFNKFRIELLGKDATHTICTNLNDGCAIVQQIGIIIMGFILFGECLTDQVTFL